ncbi:winged helix-turn-helix domain-containing protein [Halalkalicoccus sp. NIPERK01]|uniref:helix-turn-helix transcriptional regulator n=1 Tax=Halalkalicoccus sp. NIPERK01 TaxID=3053469 RepID=UPI00256F28B4|nr:MarR family transcriptional regulator [Halalkalicoccus sp. NIPERK01]MDL5363150.1 MarR family transcriptional regulator [Halalkalicoccus sp. NIPERK01]
MVPDPDDRLDDDGRPPPGSPVFEAILENERNRRYLGERLDAAGDRIDTDLLGDIVRHGPILEVLLEEPLDRREIEACLDVSRATSHRYTQWLDEQGFVEKVDGRFQLTWRGAVIAEEVLRFEANVRTAHRLTPLLEAICEDHREFVVEPFVDAMVTVAEPDDPYRPVERFIALVNESESFRGFNTTHMAPLVLGEFHQRVFDETDTEIIYLPHIVEKLFETYPERAREAIERGHLTLRTREDLPYGLALFDDRAGIGGYDETTGLMQVFVDTDAPIACEWAERVYTAVRADSDPLNEQNDLSS